MRVSCDTRRVTLMMICTISEDGGGKQQTDENGYSYTRCTLFGRPAS